MPARSSYGQGRFCWTKLETSDRDRSRTFYRELFGWEFRTVPGFPALEMALLQGEEVAGLSWTDPQRYGEGEQVWRSYLSVSSVERTAEKVKMLHGAVVAPPSDGFGGRAAHFRDPAGGTFSVWQPGERIGARLTEVPGAVSWHLLETGEPRLAALFYQGLFGWNSRNPAEGYTLFTLGGKVEAGMIATGAALESRTRWLVHFLVRDCEQSALSAVSLGGTVVQPTRELPGVGHYTVIHDPLGAVLALLTPYAQLGEA